MEPDREERHEATDKAALVAKKGNMTNLIQKINCNGKFVYKAHQVMTQESLFMLHLLNYRWEVATLTQKSFLFSRAWFIRSE